MSKKNPHPELCAWANGLREDSITTRAAVGEAFTKYYVDGSSRPSVEKLDFDNPVGIYLSEIVDDCLADHQAEIQRLRSEIALLDQERERCFQLLQAAGIPRERAKSTDNGINVLANRYDKAIDALNQDVALRDRAIEWCLEEAAFKDAQGNIWADGSGCGDYKRAKIPADLAAIISKSGGVRG